MGKRAVGNYSAGAAWKKKRRVSLPYGPEEETDAKEGRQLRITKVALFDVLANKEQDLS